MDQSQEQIANTELDGIFVVEINLASAIREQITRDYNAGKFSKFELAGRLSMSPIKLQSMLTRQQWTLRYAILIANKLGYQIQTMTKVE